MGGADIIRCDDLARLLRGQYGAVFAMLRNALETCRDGNLWGQRDGLEAPFWAQALHAIASTHFYLLDALDGTAIVSLCANLASDLAVDAGQGPPLDVPRLRRAIEALTEPDAYPGLTLDRAALLRHLHAAEIASRAILADPARLTGPNVMPWTGPMLADRMVYNLRHAQHHIGRLHAILGRNQVRVPWIIVDSGDGGSGNA